MARRSFTEARSQGFPIGRSEPHSHDWVRNSDTWVEAYFCSVCGEYQVD